ncbi:C-GCAxxG-C-C family (seleno)protein [Dysosmobacter sp.]|uniref:C-GCAxxG-C-C family (seleno)protein n=1 Tax=Dysosmobacter sp. TaxID=2591382 RepID=UPI002A8FC6F2|nr:C-GCAxxG-C-C family (seleno)protein [Dysosmobacter sp.]MDY3281738.1 C-GCAxxG-C-C family (seleno)protein [Dysosmobacter sp.]
MSLKERASDYYFNLGKGCAEAIVLAAGEVYGLNISEAEAGLFAGFRGGMGCGGTCGALTGAIAVLSRKYSRREDLAELCGRFAETFEQTMACGAADCDTLSARYKTEAGRCRAAVELAAGALEAFIDRLDGRAAAPAGEGCTLRPEDIKRVKALGFLHQKGTNKFNGRVITRNGRITNDECQAIVDAARQYGDGHMMFTTRLTVEVSGIDYGDIDAFRAAVGKAGLETGGTGSKVRPVVSCKGTTCQYGLYDTYDLSNEIHRRFFKGYADVALPHKFKIAVGGCPNNCVKPDLNDLAIVGARTPGYDPEKCRGCKKCQVETACPVHAAKLTDGRLVIDHALCNSCGRCVGKCPFHCNDEGAYGWKMFVGGRWGKRVAHGQMLSKIFTDRDEALDVVEKAILLFRDQGRSGERFADTVERLGMEIVEAQLLGDDLLRRKAEILGMNVVGGATC